jgi:tetratricopeptide (TPR) repeat protein
MQRIYDPIEEKKALAVRLIENGYFNDALRIVDDILNVTHSDPETVYLKSILLNSSGNKGEALIWAKRSVELNPDNTKSLMLKARLFHQFSFYRECMETLDEVFKINGKNTEALDLMADILLRMGKPDEAYRMVMKSISILPSSWNAHFVLSRYFQYQNMEKQSMKELEIAIRFNPESNVLRMEKIRRLMKAKKREEAEKELNRKGFMEIRETFTEILVEIEFLIESSFYEKAEVLCENAILKWPHEDLLYFSMGEISYNSARSKESISYFRKALSLNKNEWYLSRLTTILYELKEYKEITKLYDDRTRIPIECTEPVIDSFIKSSNPEDLIGVIKYNIDHFQNKDILFLMEGVVNNNLGYFILELGLVVKNTDSFAYYIDYLRDKIIKHNDPDISENHNIEGSKFPFSFLERLIKGEFEEVEKEMYLFSPKNEEEVKWGSILFYFARLNQYGTISTKSELQVLKLKYGSVYVSDAIVFLKIICSIRE